MKGSLHLFTFQHIPVKLHWSFVLIIAWFGYVVFSEGFQGSEIGWFVVLVICMFSFVVMHEFGHALAAKRYGVTTRDIILLPIGGMARLENIPENPIQELIIAIAGPMVNVALALLLLAAILLFGLWDSTSLASNLTQVLTLKGVIVLLFIMNIGLFLFNLVPAFPMDGGRVFRAFLAMKTDRLTATKWASRVGQMLAIVFFIFGASVDHYGLMMIGVFIFFAAQTEYHAVRYRQNTIKVSTALPLRALYRPNYTPLRLTQSMLWPADTFVRGMETSFVVQDDAGNFVGTLPEAQILSAIKEGREEEPIASFVQLGIPILDVRDSAGEALDKMAQFHTDIALIQEDGNPIGVVQRPVIQRALKNMKISNSISTNS